MNIVKNRSLGLITARGGSKSIPLKNIVPVCGKPLIEYSINALQKATTINRVICSTDHEKIASVVQKLGVEVLDRPDHLCGDLVSSIDVVIDAVETINKSEGSIPEIIVLIQPTSIFLTSTQIDSAVNALLDKPEAKSSQTVIKVPHQFHAHNQRIMFDDGNDIAFAFQKDREIGHNKQTKPEFYTYGNLIVIRTKALIEERTLFARPSIPIVIPLYYAYDLDGQEDIELAEIMINQKLIKDI